jgi:hypothetical protein
VSCGDVVVVLFDNVPSEVIVLWNIDVSVMKDESVFEVPVFQAFDNQSWAVLEYKFQCLAYFCIIDLRSFD